ncbi:hypothetical protein KKA53_03445 [Candidatus Dependentiae bacterium]|nr:hypothetical protein [Candidatus Dependentiae bacterium]
MQEKNKLQSTQNSEGNFKFKTTTKGKTVDLSMDFKNSDLSNTQKREIQTKIILKATGTSCHEFSELLISQAMDALINPRGFTSSANAISGALLELNPRDAMEGMLCSRLIVLQNHIMNCLAGANPSEQTEKKTDLNINRATKLSRAFNETLEALNRYRRKGQQKITVQHVNVSDGGQAIIGDLRTGGRGK